MPYQWWLQFSSFLYVKGIHGLYLLRNLFKIRNTLVFRDLLNGVKNEFTPNQEIQVFFWFQGD